MEQYSPSNYIMPPAVKNLIIVNVLFFLAAFSMQNAFNKDLGQILGLHFFTAESFKPYQFITYLFMHANFTHIFFNMFALWMFGRVLEIAWGPKRFLIYYFVTGIGASLIHYGIYYFEALPVLNIVDAYLANPSIEDFKELMETSQLPIISQELNYQYQTFVNSYNSVVGNDLPLALDMSITYMKEYREGFLNAPVVVGASGAVFGILLAFGMMFPNSIIYVYFAIPMKAKYLVMIYGAIELWSGFASSAGDNVAHFAQLGGMLFGFFLIIYWRKRPIK